uniref:PNPLA domain-containing protein n=1 Tax=Phaeomonas parva TaxID=124430 RepID=A0A7S1U1R9_9STRA|mmetsp:Transcript_27546/g.87202  ORF Transcript_27546/g.87202 Transcript_27546/m.87202 type:complete len:492 (+) Transcript_27546:314-1789(+)
MRVVLRRGVRRGAVRAPSTPLFSSPEPPQVTTLSEFDDFRRSLDGTALRTADIVAAPQDVPLDDLRAHPVARAIRERARSGYAAGSLADGRKIGLAVEGGGMRGAYVAGASTCLVHLGLTESVDEIYGSSAGSVVGAYFLSRQAEAWRVYTDVITDPKDRFIDLRRLPGALGLGLGFSRASTLARSVTPDGRRATDPNPSPKAYPNPNANPNPNADPNSKPSFSPVFNLNLLLDAMRPSGALPLDFETFRANEQRQRYHVITTASRSLQTLALNTREGDWGDDLQDLLNACRASTTVPAIAGPALRLGLPRFGGDENAEPLSDALLMEPIPYRSAVKNDCTDVLVLRSRPLAATSLGKAPSLYETQMARRFYDLEGCPEAADFIANCGHQVIYAEDSLLLAEASRSGAPAAPPSERQHDQTSNAARLLALGPPGGIAELGQLDTTRDKVLQAVAEGFVAAYQVFGDTGDAASLEAEAKAAARAIFGEDVDM